MGIREDEKIAPHCEFIHVHDKVVKRVMDVMPEGFGDSTRIRILYALSQSELCVCDIASLLGMGQSAISHQLRILKQMRLVKFRREGKSVLYSLADGHIQTILAQGMEHIGEKI